MSTAILRLKQVNIEYDDELIVRLDALAAQHGMSRTTLLREIARRAVETGLPDTPRAVVLSPAQPDPFTVRGVSDMVVELERIVRHNAKLEGELIAAKQELAEATARARGLFLPAIEKKVGEILAPLDGKLHRVVAAAGQDVANVIDAANARLDRAVEKAAVAIEANPVLAALNTRMDAIDANVARIGDAHESVRPTTIIQVWDRYWTAAGMALLVLLIASAGIVGFAFMAHWFPRTIGVPSAEFMIGGDDTIVRELIERRDLHVVPAPCSPLVGASPPTPPTRAPQSTPTHSTRHRR